MVEYQWGPWLNAGPNVPELGEYIQLKATCTVTDERITAEGYVVEVNPRLGYLRISPDASPYLCDMEYWRKRTPVIRQEIDRETEAV